MTEKKSNMEGMEDMMSPLSEEVTGGIAEDSSIMKEGTEASEPPEPVSESENEDLEFSEKAIHPETEEYREEEENDAPDIYDELDSVEYEESEPEKCFTLREYRYRSSKSFDINRKKFEKCISHLRENEYTIILSFSDLKCKYFAANTLKRYDKYGKLKLEEKELILSENDLEYKVDFGDFREFLRQQRSGWIILDLDRWDLPSREYFIRSMDAWLERRNNRILFREMLESRGLKILILLERGMIGEDGELPVVDLDHPEGEEAIEKSVKEKDSLPVLNAETPLEKKLLLMVILFRGVGPGELQDLLELTMEDEEFQLWKKERGGLLKKLGLETHRDVENGIVYLTLGGEGSRVEERVIMAIEEEDPFLVAELFEVIDKSERFWKNYLDLGENPKMDEGFLRLILTLLKTDSRRLGFSWFEEKFRRCRGTGKCFYLLAYCSVMVARNNGGDPLLLDRISQMFYEQNMYIILTHILEYYSREAGFERYQWYLRLLSQPLKDNESSKAFDLITRSLRKELDENPEFFLEFYRWWEPSYGILRENLSALLLRLASHQFNWNRTWSVEEEKETERSFPGPDREGEILHQLGRMLFDRTMFQKHCKNAVVIRAVKEGINRIFFMKILYLPQRLDIENSRQKTVLKKLEKSTKELLGKRPESLYALLLALIVAEWIHIAKVGKGRKHIDEALLSALRTTDLKAELELVRKKCVLLSEFSLKYSALMRNEREIAKKFLELRKLFQVTESLFRRKIHRTEKGGDHGQYK